jgi:hypothetical protein
MKLLAIGAVLLLAAVAMLIFSDLNPATPFIAGGVCAFLGFINLLTPPDRGRPVSAGDTSDAVDLTRDIRSHQ